MGGQTNAGLDGLTVSNCSFTNTTYGLRLKAGPAKLSTDGVNYNPFTIADGKSGNGGVVKNVSYSNITMTNVGSPIIINSWYVDADHYGSAQVGPSSLKYVTDPGETTHILDQETDDNSVNMVPYFDNIRFTNITATGASTNVTLIYGLNSQPPPGNPNGDPKCNIDNVSFNNVSLTGTYLADIYYASRLDTSGLKVNGNTVGIINQTGNSSVLPSYSDYTIWQGGNITKGNFSPTDWNNAYNWTSALEVTPSGAGIKVAFGNQDASNNVVDMISSGQTVGAIYYSPDTSTTIQSSGGYSLTLDNSGSASTIDVAGSHTIAVPVLLNNDVNITGTGTLTLSGGISGAYAINVQGVNLTATSISVNTLAIGSGTTVTIQPSPGGPLASNDNLQSVPEPSVLALLGIDFIGLLAYPWRRRASRCAK